MITNSIRNDNTITPIYLKARIAVTSTIKVAKSFDVGGGKIAHRGANCRHTADTVFLQERYSILSIEMIVCDRSSRLWTSAALPSQRETEVP